MDVIEFTYIRINIEAKFVSTDMNLFFSVYNIMLAFQKGMCELAHMSSVRVNKTEPRYCSVGKHQSIKVENGDMLQGYCAERDREYTLSVSIVYGCW